MPWHTLLQPQFSCSRSTRLLCCKNTLNAMSRGAVFAALHEHIVWLLPVEQLPQGAATPLYSLGAPACSEFMMAPCKVPLGDPFGLSAVHMQVSLKMAAAPEPKSNPVTYLNDATAKSQLAVLQRIFQAISGEGRDSCFAIGRTTSHTSLLMLLGCSALAIFACSVAAVDVRCCAYCGCDCSHWAAANMFLIRNLYILDS
jgi:hypothetical protein